MYGRRQLLKLLGLASLVGGTAPAGPALGRGGDMPFVRVGQFKAKEDLTEELCRIYSTEAIPAIRAADGNVGALLLRPHQSANDFLAITVWTSKDHAEAYDKSGQAKQIVDKVRHAFASARFSSPLTPMDMTSARPHARS
jgi:quinol monooxygenase YgiN